MNKCICFNYKYDSDYKSRIRLIKDIGFNSVFIYSQYNPADYIELIIEASINIDSLHLPYKKVDQGTCIDSKYVNVLWKREKESEVYIKELIDEIKFAHNYNIGTVIMHITAGDNPPEMNEHGIANIEKVLNFCEKYNITLCLENLRRLDYLDFVFTRINSEKLKFCFDSGHANAMTRNIELFPWDKFGDKLYYLHLNDNNGIKDEHLIPFEGNINWTKLINQISSYSKSIGLTLEVRSSQETRSHYSEYEYLKQCYSSITRLHRIMEDI